MISLPFSKLYWICFEQIFSSTLKKLLNVLFKVLLYLFLPDFTFFFFVLGDTLACSGNPTEINGIRLCATSVQRDIYRNITLLLTDLCAQGNDPDACSNLCWIKDWNLLVSTRTSSTVEHYKPIPVGFCGCREAHTTWEFHNC